MGEYSVRSVTPDDAEQIAEIYGWYVENTAVTFEYDAPDAEEIRDRICRYQRRYPYLCVTDGDEIVGFAFAHAFRERPAYDYAAETSIYLHSDMRRKGIGTLVYTALEDALRQMGVTNLYACIAVPDGEDPCLSPASPLFHEKLGYRICGTFNRCGRKFGRWYTMVWMEKIIGEYAADPLPLKPYSEIGE